MAKFKIEMECSYSDLKVVRAIADLCNGTLISQGGNISRVLDEHDRVVATVEEVDENQKHKADFLWPHDEGSVEEAAYEYVNANTEAYREQWWNILMERVKGVGDGD